MQVAPMPERPPLRNGLTAFQVALSARDIVARGGSVGCVARGEVWARAAIAGPPGAAAGAPEAGETKLQSVLRTMRLLRDDRDGAAAAARARAVVTTTPTREPPPTADAPAVKRVRFAP